MRQLVPLLFGFLSPLIRSRSLCGDPVNPLPNNKYQGRCSQLLHCVYRSIFLNAPPSILYSTVPASGPDRTAIPTAFPVKGNSSSAPGFSAISTGTCTNPGRVLTLSAGAQSVSIFQPRSPTPC